MRISDWSSDVCSSDLFRATFLLWRACGKGFRAFIVGSAISPGRSHAYRGAGMPKIDEKLVLVFDAVLRRNAGEVEFHKAVEEVLESLGSVIAKHPDYMSRALIEMTKTRRVGTQ